MKSWLAIFLTLILQPFAVHAQEIPAVVQAILGQACTMDGIPVINGRISPKNNQDRIQLFIRCELKGGADEFTTNSCCDHLTASDGQIIGQCPDTALGGVWMTFVKATQSC